VCRHRNLSERQALSDRYCGRFQIKYIIFFGTYTSLQSGLRRRFSLALQWFNVVRDQSQGVVQQWLDKIRTYAEALDKAEKTDDDAMEIEGENSMNQQVQPSAYLRRRCAMCFGGDWSSPKEGSVPFL
jgi:hypothetical protein